MKNTPRIILFLVILCGGSALAATLEEEIGEYLASLSDAKTVEQVDAIIEQASSHLDANRAGSSEVTRGFIQADIQQARGRACVNLWLRDKADEAMRDTARTSLFSSIATYQKYSNQADEDADKLAEGLRGSAQRSRRWQNFAGYASRANYSRAWSYYALGLLDVDKEKHIDLAIEYFEPFTNGGYRDNRIVQDCFLGYALCLFEQGRIAAAADLLNDRRIRPDNTAPDVFRQVTLLRIRIQETSNSPLGVEWAGELYFQNRPADANQYDPIEQQILLKRIEALAQLSAAADHSYAADFRATLAACRRLLADQAPQYNAVALQILHAAGVQTALGSLQKAKVAYDAAEFRQALDLTQTGLDMADSTLEAETIVDLKFLKCLCLNKLGQYGDVVQQVQSFLKMVRQDSRLSTLSQIGMEAAIAASKAGQAVNPDTFEQFAAVFAVDENQPADLLTWYRAGFATARGRFARAESLLATVAPDSPVASRCLYLRSFAAYQQSRQGGFDPQALLRAMNTATAFGITANETVEDWVCGGMFDLIVAIMGDCVRADVPIKEPMAILDAAEKLPCMDDLRKTRLLAAKVTYLAKWGELDAVRDILRQIKKQPYQENLANAMLGAAELLTSENAQPDKVSLAADIFNLVLETGKDAAPDRRTAILWKLAESLRRAARYDIAAQRYQEILDADAPRVQVRVVRGLSMTYQAMQDYDQAAKQWRQLTRLTTPNIPGWYEAHYELIRCHQLAGDTDKAAQLLAYFRVKYPDPLPAEWADKFAGLERGPNP